MIRFAVLCAVAFAAPALGQPAAMPGMRHDPAPAATGPSTSAFKQADDTMMRSMNRPLSGDPDQDFVAGMLPHHQGAVDMAKVELQYGKDPALRRLARAIIAAQNKEIGLMRAWQKQHPAQP